MARYKLSVHVMRADGLSEGSNSLNPYVELRFAGQKFSTVNDIVGNPAWEWNRTFHFNSLDKDKAFSGTLEAYVYTRPAEHKTFVGRVRIPGSTFFDETEHPIGGPTFAVNPAARGKDYPLSGGIIFPRSRGTLHLTVRLERESPIQTSDPFSSVIRDGSLGEITSLESSPPQPADLKITETKPVFVPGMIVEHMPYVFVRVVKAQNLPHLDARGRLDHYVEVKVGDSKGNTGYMNMEHNIENGTFAFSKVEMDRKLLSVIYVTLKSRDMVKDDIVGMVSLNVRDIQQCSSPYEKPVLEWHSLADENGSTIEAELMLSLWMGSQAHEAFDSACKPDSNIKSKVYSLPRLWYLRVIVSEMKCIPVARTEEAVGVDITAVLGDQQQGTVRVEKPLGHHVWNNEELVFVAAEPFSDDLRISVQTHDGPRISKLVGQINIPSDKFEKRIGSRLVKPQWFDLLVPEVGAEAEAEASAMDKLAVSSCSIRLMICLEGGYSVRYDSMDYADDFQPASAEIRYHPSVGLLEIGILGANGLHPRKRMNGASTLHPYCVAKYGQKWVRTRTIINSCTPAFNEQYTWPVYDTATVLTIGVFDNGHLEGYSPDENKGPKIGKVRIRLSNLQPGQLYNDSYPLLVLGPTGIMDMGKLRLAVRFKPESVLEMLRMYSRPSLPKMHYTNKLSVVVQENLRPYAVKIVAARFSRMEPPLWTEVVEYMCDVRSNFWSIRKSKVNLSRLTDVLQVPAFFAAYDWFAQVCLWKNHVTTVLVHILFLILVLYPDLILPSIFLYAFGVTMWRWHLRQRHQPHADIRVSQVHTVSQEELSEEFDPFPTSQDYESLKSRYDILRSIAGRAQTSLGEVASCGEKIQALGSWRDTTATAIFALFSLASAIVLYIIPFELILLFAGLYIMRHPKFRVNTQIPSFLGSFYRRLPDRTDILL